MNNMDLMSKYLDGMEASMPFKVSGKISKVVGLVIESTGPAASVGELCRIEDKGRTIGYSEVVGFREGITLLMPLGYIKGIRPGQTVYAEGRDLTVGISEDLRGRVLDGLGRVIDEGEALKDSVMMSIDNEPPSPLKRKRITDPMVTGIKSIDGLTTLGKGQRVGIFAGSGVGKSVLMGMIARNCRADINVIALIGERGREVREFIENDLGEEGLRRSVVVAATSDQPALIRVKAAFVATAIAEYFRKKGNDVMFFLDSATRIATAQREIGLAAGEPPATRGYPPSVFALLPRLLERTGTSAEGSITGLYTVLVEGDDMDEPVSDAMRGILDGHILLDRSLADKKHYPAINTLGSVSRLMNQVADQEHKAAASELLKVMAAYRDAEDLINIGAYARGSSPDVDRAVSIIGDINDFLTQGISEKSDFRDTVARLRTIVETSR
ncbi:MAG: FliI/YscN family ATPase [Fibrobacterota bacterium]